MSAAAHDAQVDVEFHDGYPVTVNDPGSADFSLGVAREVLGDNQVVKMPNPVMGAEDFSYVLNRIPGSMMFLGGTPLDRDLSKAAPNHSNRVVLRRAGHGRRHGRVLRHGHPPPRRLTDPAVAHPSA